MQLVMKNFKWSSEVNDNLLRDIIGIIKSKLETVQVDTSMKVLDTTREILFTPNNNRLFTSTVDNKVVMKKADPRIKSLGRDYLLSRRTTQKQMDAVWYDAINKTLDNLGVDCDIFYIKDENMTQLRSGSDVGSWIKEVIYPIAKEG